jgi:hypothetical protein
LLGLVPVVVLAVLVVACDMPVPGDAAADPPAPAEPGAAIKWHPGHYVQLDGVLRADNRASLSATHREQIAELANEPTITGVKIFVQWSAAEGDTAGDYAAGKELIQQYVDWVSAIDKQLWISFLHVQFGGYDPSNLEQFFPRYIVTDERYGTTAMRNGIVTRVWQQPTMDRIIAQVRSYGETFNSSPWVEALQIDETAVAVADGTDDFSTSGVVTQYKRFLSAARAAWPNTGLRLAANYLGSDEQMAELIRHCAELDCMVGGPDVIPSEDIQGNRVFTGESPPSGAVDYRGAIPFVAEIQSPELGGHEGTWTPQQLYEHAMEGDSGAGIRATQPQYFVWYRNTWSGGDDQRWIAGSKGILPFIRSVDGAVHSTACPSSYPVCTTS